MIKAGDVVLESNHCTYFMFNSRYVCLRSLPKALGSGHGRHAAFYSILDASCKIISESMKVERVQRSLQRHNHAPAGSCFVRCMQTLCLDRGHDLLCVGRCVSEEDALYRFKVHAMMNNDGYLLAAKVIAHILTDMMEERDESCQSDLWKTYDMMMLWTHRRRRR